MLEFAFDQFAVGKLFARVAPRPFTGDERLDQIKLAGFETLELRRVVFVETVSDAVKVEHAHAHIEITPPVVWVTVITDIATKGRWTGDIRTTGNRKLGDDFVKGLAGSAILLAPARAKHRHAAHDQRQFRIRALEFKTDCAGV